MQTALVEIFTRNGKTPEGDIGIEIEVEAEGRLPNINTTWWATKNEPSLRNGGLEYTTKGALPVDALMMKRITALTTAIDNPLTKVDKKSHRTSVHVHHNVGKYTPVQVWTAVTAYWLFENLLFKACGEEREGNSFCLRLKDAESLLGYVLDDFKADHPFVNLDTDHIRYAGANLNAINRFGSIELRGMRGTVDPEIIHDWSYLTHHLFKNAIAAFSTPESLLDFYFYKGPKKTAELLLKPTKTTNFITAVKGMDDLVEENAYRLASVMYVPNWHMYTARINKKAELLLAKKEKSKKKEPSSLNEIALNEGSLVARMRSAQVQLNAAPFPTPTNVSTFWTSDPAIWN